MSTLSRGNRPGSSGRFEVLSWYFMRVSGAALLLLAVAHLLLMHILIGVENITFDVIIQRWQSPFWQVYDLALLLFALLHGVNGTRWVIDDYFHRRGWNVFLKTALYVVAFVFILMGAQVIFTADASSGQTAIGAIAAALTR